MNVQPRGSFGHTPVVSLTDHCWPPGNHEDLFMGLPIAGQHLWGSFRVGDERVVPIRQTQNDLAIRFLQYAGADNEALGFTTARPGYTGLCDVETRDGLWGVWQPGPGQRFAFATDETRALWRERDEFEVIGEPAGHAIQLAVPDAGDPLGYRARYWRVTGGNRAGEPVTGVFAHEQVYVRPGSGWFTSPYCGELEQAWVVFYTEYADGTVHHGHLQRGRDGFAFAAVQRTDGDPVISADVRCTPTFDGDDNPDRMLFEVGDGTSWTYRPSQPGAGVMPLPGPPTTTPRWREGVVTPLGETRQVVFAHAWMEAFPSRFELPN